MNKEEMSVALQYIKDVANRLTNRQEKVFRSMCDKTDRKINEKVNTASKKLAEQTISEIKERLEVVNDMEKLNADIKELRRITESLIEKQTVLTEVSYLGRQRLTSEGQAHLNAELIKSMDFSNDWFHKRNDLSLNKWFDLYQNGVTENAIEE